MSKKRCASEIAVKVVEIRSERQVVGEVESTADLSFFVFIDVQEAVH